MSSECDSHFQQKGKEVYKDMEEWIRIRQRVLREGVSKRQILREAGTNQALVDTIIDLTKLRKPVAGWQPVGTPKLEDRIWRFKSFDA
ncbi:MAG: hypothetical protein MIO92_16445, partial [Methanosarcinaceae archaeon]|nr:hypothetical protein [Methanosarcinaceae archaeon]